MIATREASCPTCGERDGEILFASRAQLARSTQSFRFVRCRTCTLVYLRDVPVGADESLYGDAYPLHQGAALWGRFAPLVAGSFRRLDERRVRAIAAASSLDKNSAILDVGCGQGTFLAAAKTMLGVQSVGLEVTASTLNSPVCRKLHRASKLYRRHKLRRSIEHSTKFINH